jgi:trans-aconitate methyltransferase
MQSKPERFSVHYAESFKDQQVVNAYRYRPPYPDEVFDLLVGLCKDEPRAVLDVGAGSGDLARRLAGRVERVDAVDFSQQMIERGRELPNGNHPQLRWIYGKVEEVPLTPPYALITAGSSIHWTEWSIAFPRFHSLLTPSGVLALVHRRILPMPWSADLRALQTQFSTRSGHSSADVVEALEGHQWFQKQGVQETAPVAFVQTLDDFLEGLHSRSSFARERMGAQNAADFDIQVRNLLLPFHSDGLLSLQVVGNVAWGRPAKGLVL